MACGTVSDTLVIGVVEDDSSFRRALGRLVTGAGFRVATFASAEEFLASGSAGTTACLVLDVHLGGMNGFELQQRLSAADSPIPTIFITAHDNPITRARALRRGLSPEALSSGGLDRCHPAGARTPGEPSSFVLWSSAASMLVSALS